MVIYTNVMILKIPVSAVAHTHNNCIAVKSQVRCLTLAKHHENIRGTGYLTLTPSSGVMMKRETTVVL